MIRSEKMFALGDVLGPQLAALQTKAAAMASLTDIVRAALPESARSHLVGASRRQRNGVSTLVVMVDSGAWTARVRFAEEDIRRHLKEANEPDCERVWVRVVRPDESAPDRGG